ncbi:MAG: hypothetical protein K9J13_15875 [Saprospiraceae bacterium]|nr:hypothetical protein [Saprospiraceae bacterium]
MFKILKKDSFKFGIAIGIILPLVIYAILYFIAFYFKILPYLKESTLQLIAIFINMFLLRYYLLKVKFDKSGRGVMFATFVLAIVYFVFFMME